MFIHNVDDADIEFWYARELMQLLGYERWENFDKAVSRAMESCATSDIKISDHFRPGHENGLTGQWCKKKY